MSLSAAAQNGSDALLAEIVEEFTNRVQAGESVDVESYAQKHPEHAARLRQLLPALALLNDLGRSASAVADDNPSASGEGSLAGVVGDFRIVREVGKGGMGVVYEAEQISLRRRVALKVLPLAATMDARHLQRFHNEAQAAACLHHTNIVTVFSVGSERGVHFYAMQFIDGQTLSDLIRQLQHAGKKAPTLGEEVTAAYQPTASEAAPTPQPAAEMTPLTGEGRRSRDYYRKVAELGIQAAEALDHAHQLGIVHRDIKPGNLLLDGLGRLWVTDFGLAHIQHGEASLTLTGQALGTPRYMSPEQALAKRVPIDHRTDVYSLGVTLYELLTLRPAFTSEDRHELLRQIAFEEPTKPRRLERYIPAELEIIVLKAMEKRPQDRYATAQELADDLQRWLKHEPIRARRPGWVQRTTKWGRRHRPLVFGIAVSLFLALIVLAISNAVIWREHQETKTALEKARIFQTAVDRQMAREVRFREEFEVKLQRSIRAMDGILASIDKPFPDEETKPAQLRQAIFEQGVNYYREVLPIETRRPSLIRETMWAYVQLGNLYVWRNQFAEAKETYGKACRTAMEWVQLTRSQVTDGEPSGPEISPSGEILDRPAVVEAYRRALAHWREKSPVGLESVSDDFRVRLIERERPRVYPPTHREFADYYGKLIRVYERVLEDLSSPIHMGNYALRVLDYGRELQADGRVDEAKAVYRQAVKRAENWVAGVPVSKEGRPDLLAARRQRWRHADASSVNQLAGDLMKISSRLEDLNAPGDSESAIRVCLALLRQWLGEMDWVRSCERMLEVEGKLSALLTGRRQPVDSSECLGLAYLYQRYRDRHAAAARFYRDAFSKEPKRADDLNNQYRYDAACAAALAGCGQGVDADKLDAQERARLRQQALDWLRADLKAYRQLMEKSAVKNGPSIAQRMQHWLHDRDFAGVRGDEALAKLPEEERSAWRKLWADGAGMLAKAQGKTSAEKKPDAK